MTSNIEDKPRIFKGLAGVVVDTTAISKVVPETNSLTYRGYAVQDLATQRSLRPSRTTTRTTNGPNEETPSVRMLPLTWGFGWSRLSESNRRPSHYE